MSTQPEAASETQQLAVPESQVTVADASGTAAKRKRGRPSKNAATSGVEGQSVAPTAGSSTSASKGGDGQSASAAKRQSAAAAKLERDIDARLAKHRPGIVAEAVAAMQRSWESQYQSATDLLKQIRLERTVADVERDNLEPSSDGFVHFRVYSATWLAIREAVIERGVFRSKVDKMDDELGQQLIQIADHQKAISELTEAMAIMQQRNAAVDGVGSVGMVSSTISTGTPLEHIDPRLTGASSASIAVPQATATTSSHARSATGTAASEKRIRKNADLNQRFLDNIRSMMGIHRNDPLPDYPSPSDEESWPRHQNREKMLRFRWTESTNDERVSEVLGQLARKYTYDEAAKLRYGATGKNFEEVMRILKDQFRSKKKAYHRQTRLSRTQQNEQSSGARRRARKDTRLTQIEPVVKAYGLHGEGWHAALTTALALEEATTSDGSDGKSDAYASSGRPVRQVLPAWASWELYQLWSLTFKKVDRRNHSTRVIKPTYRTVWDRPLPPGTQPWMVDGGWMERVKVGPAVLPANSGPFDGSGPARSASKFGTSVRLPVRAADGSELPADQDRLHNGAGAEGEPAPRYGPEASSCEPLKMGLDAWLNDRRNPCHPEHLAADSGYQADVEVGVSMGSIVDLGSYVSDDARYGANQNAESFDTLFK